MTTRTLPREEWTQPERVTPRPILIREAQESEIDAIVDMGVQFFAETPYGDHMIPSPDRMRALVQQLIAGPGRLFVAERIGLCGMIGMTLFEHPMVEERCASELFWWVDPDARGSIGLRLLRHAEAWARAAGASRIFMISPSERVSRMYHGLGYFPLETCFTRRL